MAWEVEFTDEFGVWWNERDADEQTSIDAVVHVLEERGPTLGRPYVDKVQSSEYINMKELRVQHAGKPYRILFAFDPKSNAILLIGGDKTGNKNWYDEFVPKADKLFGDHLKQLKKEENDGKKI